MNVPNHLSDPIKKRYSPMIFQDKAIPKDVLKKMFEAAQWAPSSYNEQPWRFIVGIKGEGDAWQKILSCLSEGNQIWASTCPVLIITAAKEHFAYNDKPNKHFMHDVGLAAENLVLEAMQHDIYAHQMAGFSEEKAIETLNIPDGFVPVTAIGLGYEGNIDDIENEDLLKRGKEERTRLPLGEIVFEGEFGSSLFND